MNTRRWLALVLAVVLFLVSIGFSFAMNVVSGLFDDMFSLDEYAFGEEIIEQGDFDERIAVLNLEGMILDTETSLFATDGYQHEHFLQMIRQAGEDPTTAAILLNIDTP